jgi:GNAT superfamily N-acetyltransferase
MIGCSLVTEASPDFYRMTFTDCWDAVDLIGNNDAIVAVQATFLFTPIGFALAGNNEYGSGVLLSVYVDPQFRGAGVGTLLITRIVEELSSRQCATIMAVYMSNRPTSPALARIFEKCGWSAPLKRMSVLESDIETIASAPWQRVTPLSCGYELFPWKHLTAADNSEIAETSLSLPWFPSDLNPLAYPDFEHQTSLGLRFNGHLIGWIITHEMSRDRLRFTCGWVKAEHQRRGRCIPYLNLVVESISRGRAAEYTKATWTIPEHHAGMRRFAERWLRPFATSWSGTYEVRKQLK